MKHHNKTRRTPSGSRKNPAFIQHFIFSGMYLPHSLKSSLILPEKKAIERAVSAVSSQGDLGQRFCILWQSKERVAILASGKCIDLAERFRRRLGSEKVNVKTETCLVTRGDKSESFAAIGAPGRARRDLATQSRKWVSW